jgi:hypothetical protein
MKQNEIENYKTLFMDFVDYNTDFRGAITVILG